VTFPGARNLKHSLMLPHGWSRTQAALIVDLASATSLRHMAPYEVVADLRSWAAEGAGQECQWSRPAVRPVQRLGILAAAPGHSSDYWWPCTCVRFPWFGRDRARMNV
jgi:hypothetical protein